MDILILLIPISLVLVGLALWAFFWASNHEQFDDLESQAERILFEDDEALIPDDAKPKTSTDKTSAGQAATDSLKQND